MLRLVSLRDRLSVEKLVVAAEPKGLQARAVLTCRHRGYADESIPPDNRIASGTLLRSLSRVASAASRECHRCDGATPEPGVMRRTASASAAGARCPVMPHIALRCLAFSHDRIEREAGNLNMEHGEQIRAPEQRTVPGQLFFSTERSFLPKI
jgi:hypothetical protein